MIKCLFAAALLAAVALARPAAAGLPEDFAGTVALCHGADKLPADKVIRTGITVEFGGNTPIDGTLTFTTRGGKSRLEQRDGTVAVFDGRHAWVAGGTLPRARFHLRTWPYFALAPFKLGDPGATLKPEGTKTLDGKQYVVARMTFAPGTGDSPDDWYLLYRDPTTGLLTAMAYVVTYGGKNPADAQPHAIVYSDFKTVDGVTFATTWTFRHWSVEKGLYGDPVGHATLKHLALIDPPPGAFDKPAGATEDTMPAADGAKQ